MKVNKLSLNNFRNYETGNWHFSDQVNVFYGDNGQGKTNLLEAIYFSALGSSHRTFLESDLVRQNTDHMSLILHFQSAYIEKKITINKKNEKARKEIILDTNKIKPRELIGELKTTIFSPEDLLIVKSEPSFRRRFIDMELAQVSSSFCFSLARYNKIVQQRNKLLHEIREKNTSVRLLEAWDVQFAKEAAYIVKMRIKAMEKISLLAKNIYQDIAGKKEETGCVYKRRENGGDCFFNDSSHFEENMECFYREMLFSRREKDIERGSTGVGPHRDDILFTIEERPLKVFGSQGQQRSFVLALKLAELQFIKDETDEFPILLLDDVMSELDPARRNNLLDFLNGRVQTFITLTDKELINNFKNASYYYVQGGKTIEES